MEDGGGKCEGGVKTEGRGEGREGGKPESIGRKWKDVGKRRGGPRRWFERRWWLRRSSGHVASESSGTRSASVGAAGLGPAAMVTITAGAATGAGAGGAFFHGEGGSSAVAEGAPLRAEVGRGAAPPSPPPARLLAADAAPGGPSAVVSWRSHAALIVRTLTPRGPWYIM